MATSAEEPLPAARRDERPLAAAVARVRRYALVFLAVAAVRAQEGAPKDNPRQTLEQALQSYFAAPADGPLLAETAKLARGHEDLLAEVLRTKSFVPRTDKVARRGRIDEQHRFVDEADASNAALFAGPATADRLHPFVVYVPDATDTAGFAEVIARDGADRGWYVYLVPDERRDNRWNPNMHEHARHTGPLRDLLLQYPIDPDRVYMIGSGRGGHATWDVGMLAADRWAAIFPCNGGLIHEGGYKATGGVYLDNAKCFAVFTVYNTTFDHGIESCRYATRKFREWGYRCEAVEEPQMRHMAIPEATGKVAAVVRAAHPRLIQKRFNHLPDGDHYWLRALERAREWDPKDEIVVRGKWPDERDQQLELVWEQVRTACGFLRGQIAGNRLEITARGVGRVRVYFDPELVDFDAKATVVLNGKAGAPFKLVKKPEVLLRHVHETGDTSRLYWDYVDLRVER